MNKVLITGATGFIGSHLVERNLEEGNQVRILALPDDPIARKFETRGIEVSQDTGHEWIDGPVRHHQKRQRY